LRPPHPPSALASARQRLLRWRPRCPRASGQPSCSRSGLPAATRPAPRLGFVPAPDGGGGQGTLVAIGRGPSVGLCPSAPHTAVEAPAPSLSNSAPWPSASEAALARSRTTRARLLQWPSRVMRRCLHPSPPGECSSRVVPAAAGDPNRDSYTSGTGASGSGCGATSDVHSADTGAPEGCSYAGTRCDLDRPRRQVSSWGLGGHRNCVFFHGNGSGLVEASLRYTPPYYQTGASCRSGSRRTRQPFSSV
jgi:hypothetical protein